MQTDSSTVTIHMVSSLDGFIARKDEDPSWMHSTDNFEKGCTLTEEYIAEFLKSIDGYVMGSRTYEQALQLGWPYGFLTTSDKNTNYI
jgi:dihydrofolate reductase